MKQFSYSMILCVISLSLSFPVMALATSNARLAPHFKENKSAQLSAAIAKGELEAFIMKQGITRSSRATTALLFEADLALANKQGDEAIQLALMASKLSSDSPLPEFFLAKAYWQLRPFKPTDAILHFLAGMSLLCGDVVLLVDLFTPLALLFMLASLMCVLVFILYSLISYLPAWLHQLSQHARLYLHPLSSALLFCLLFLSPVMLGLPPLYFLLFSFLLFWRFYSPSEKGGVMIFLLGLATSAWVLPLLLTLLTAKSSLLIDEMYRNIQGDTLVTPMSIGQSGNEATMDTPAWEVSFLRAVNESRQGHYEKARIHYEDALRENPASPGILNNLGNLSFYQQDYGRASKYYEEAIASAPEFMPAHYNLGQVFREKLLFGEGDAQFARMSAIDASLAEDYAMQSARFPDFPVIEEGFSKEALWSALLRVQEKNRPFGEAIWKSAVGSIPLKYSPLLALVCIAVLLSSTFLSDRFFSASLCAFCKKAICKKCSKRLYSYQACLRCRMEFGNIRKKSDYKIIEDAVRRVPAKLYPLFLLPGGGHLAAQMTKRALFFLTLFFLLLTTIVTEKALIVASPWYLHHEGSFFQGLLLLLLYFVAIFDLVQMRKRRLWL